MTRASFLPTAAPAVSIEYLDPSGDRPSDVNEEELLLEREPRSPRKPFKRCNLSLRRGCYQLLLAPTDSISVFSPRFEGTMRMEINPGDTTISGDLYRVKPIDDIVLQQFSRDAGVVGPPAETIFTPRKPTIPIKPRSKYFSYLRVVRIETSPVLAPLARLVGPPIFDLCSITLTVEEFRYTHPSVGQATGSFPSTPDRTLGFVLRKASVPSGFAGPAFEGDVFENGKRLPFKVSLLWVSEFFRRARLELENVTGVDIPASVGGSGFRSAYGHAGWDVRVVTGNTDIAQPAGVAPAWSAAELHAFMLANRNPATNLDQEWQFHHVSVPLDFTPDSGILGIMFDQIGDEREGACNFMRNFTGVHDDDRVRLRSAIHEVGHGFNQLHPSGEGLPDDNSIMTQTGSVRQFIEDSGGTYPDDISFTFNAHDRHHLIHAPDVVVRPGGEDFSFGHDGTFAPEAQDHAKAKGLELRVVAANGRLKLGEPLLLRIELVNAGKRSISLPAVFSAARNNVAVVVKRQGSEERRLRSFVLVCHDERVRELAPEGSMVFEEVVFWDRNGVVFPQPGPYLVAVEAHWFDGEQPLAVQASVNLWVDYPVSEKENAIAAVLLDDEVGKYVALGGNAVHLKRAVARIGQAAKLAANHPAVERIAAIDKEALDCKQRLKAKRSRK